MLPGWMSGRLNVLAMTFTPDAFTISLSYVLPLNGTIVPSAWIVRAWNPDRLASSRWVVQREIPIVKETLWLKPYTKVYSSFFTYQGLPAGKMPTKVGDHFELATHAGRGVTDFQ